MADRITQLQDCVNMLAEHFCNSVGVLSTQVEPGEEAEAKRKEVAVTFSQLITRTAKDIDFLIQSLPSAQCTGDIQCETLSGLEDQNQASAKQLAELVESGEVLSKEVKSSLTDLADHQLAMLRKEKSCVG